MTNGEVWTKCSSHPYALLRAFVAFEQEGDLHNLKHCCKWQKTWTKAMRTWVDDKMQCPGISLAVSDFRLLPSPSPILALTSVSLHVVVNGSSYSSRLYILFTRAPGTLPAFLPSEYQSIPLALIKPSTFLRSNPGASLQYLDWPKPWSHASPMSGKWSSNGSIQSKNEERMKPQIQIRVVAKGGHDC